MWKWETTNDHPVRVYIWLLLLGLIGIVLLCGLVITRSTPSPSYKSDAKSDASTTPLPQPLAPTE